MKAEKSKPGFWDNLVPLKGELFGSQLPGWTPGPAARPGLGGRVRADPSRRANLRRVGFRRNLPKRV